MAIVTPIEYQGTGTDKSGQSYAAANDPNKVYGGGAGTAPPPTPLPNPQTTTAPATAPVPAPSAPTGTPAPATPPANPTPTQGQFYYTKSQDANGKPVVTYYDANGNALTTNPIGGDQYKLSPEQTPNATGRLVQLPNAPTEGGFTQTPQTSDQLNAQIQGAAGTANAQLSALNDASDKAYTDYQTRLNQIESGTFPLTPQQKALLDSTTAMFDQLRQQQIIANQTYTQGMQTFEARSGELAGGQTTAMGNIQNAINTGLAKLSAIDQKAAETLANLESGFQTDNLKLITDSYDAWTKYASQKTAAIKDIRDSTTAALKDLRDYTIKQAQQVFDNSMATKKENFSESIQKLDAQLKSAQLDETTRHNIISEKTAQEVAAHGRYEVVTNPIDGSQSIFDKSTGKFEGTPTGGVQGGKYNGVDAQGNQITPGNTGIPLLDNHTVISTSGIPYIDGTTLNWRQAAAMEEDAARLGLPYIGKAQAAGIGKISESRSIIDNIRTQFISFGAMDATGRIIGAPDRALSGIFQTNDQISSWNAWRTGAIATIMGIAAGGTGLRINQPEIALAVQNDIPTINDTIGVANAKLAKLTSMLDSNEATMFGGTDRYNWMKAANSPNPLTTYSQSSADHAKAVGAALTQFPTYTDGQIMQLLPGDVTNWKFGIANGSNVTNESGLNSGGGAGGNNGTPPPILDSSSSVGWGDVAKYIFGL